jgi:hypothetical protein
MPATKCQASGCTADATHTVEFPGQENASEYCEADAQKCAALALDTHGLDVGITPIEVTEIAPLPTRAPATDA